MSGSDSRISGFYRLPIEERRAALSLRTGLSEAGFAAFDPASGLDLATADHLIENVVGTLALPVGVALNFVVNDEPVVVPMAVEEPSIVAACSHIALLAREGGGFAADADASNMIAQVQLMGISDMDRASAAISTHRDALIDEANLFCAGLKRRGGGVREVEFRVLPALSDVPGDDGRAMAVVHFVVGCCDAMGANAINTVAEGMAPRLEELTGGRARLRILSNLADRRLARASCRIPFAALARGDRAQGRAVAEGVYEAWLFAARDPYRATTHNKGILNGIDAVAVATGNDWRAIEAGAHAYAARGGHYGSLTRYVVDEARGELVCSIELPMAVGTVGGSTRVHPSVKAARGLLGDFALHARKLAGLMAAVGLAQNLGALKALATDGIQRGHMRLHARQIAIAAGAAQHEVPVLAARLVELGEIRVETAAVQLEAMREGTHG